LATTPRGKICDEPRTTEKLSFRSLHPLFSITSAAAAPMRMKAATTTTAQPLPPGKRIEKSAHPLAGIGGYRIPTKGTIGGARGVGIIGGVSKPAAAKQSAGKAPGGAMMSQEEKEAIAKREAARARLAARNAAAFGM